MARENLKHCVTFATEKFNALYESHKDDIDAHIKSVWESKAFQSFEVRIAWDIARAVRYHQWECLFGLGYSSSDLNTLFKQALKASKINITDYQ